MMDFTNSFLFELWAFTATGWPYGVTFTLLGVGMNFAFLTTKERFKKYLSIMFSIWFLCHMYGYFFLIAPGGTTSWWPVALGYYPATLAFYMIIGFSLAQLFKNFKAKNTK